MAKPPQTNAPLAGQDQGSGAPRRAFPTPHIADVLLTEFIETHAAGYKPLPRGTPYRDAYPDRTDYNNHELLAEVPTADWRFYQRIWSAPRIAQDTYNFTIDYSGESNAAPIFAREYYEKRDGYVPRAKQSAFMGVYLVRVTNGGTGYSADNLPTVSFSGGGGSGTSARTIVSRLTGKITAIEVTAEGDNYTSAPAVAIAGGGGSGASATAVIQSSGCILVAEKMLKAEPPYDSLYVRVLRIYETLPGPELRTLGFDNETGATLSRYRQRVALPTNPIALGTIKNSQKVYDSRVEPETSVVGTLTIEAIQWPMPSRVQQKTRGFPFPALFNFIMGWVIPTTDPDDGFVWAIQPPYAGINFTLLGHRIASKPMEITTTYSDGPIALPDTWQVQTPGVAEKFGFGIQENTIHNSMAFSLYNSGTGNSIEVINVDASTPATYDPTDVLIIFAEQERWKGTIYRQQIGTITESP